MTLQYCLDHNCSFTLRAMLDRTRDRIIVLHKPEWHAGVIGIVASRLVEKYHLPVVLMTTIDGMAKGTARSIRKDARMSCSCLS